MKERESTIKFFTSGKETSFWFCPSCWGIESGVSELIHEIASDDSMYLFEGLKVKGNHVLHITSTRFNEPVCLSLVHTHHYTFALHGYGETEVLQTLVGGTDREKAAETVKRLTLNGFPAVLLSESDRYSGTHPHNINNQCLTGKSVQLEISQAQRRHSFKTSDGAIAVKRKMSNFIGTQMYSSKY